MATRRTRSRGQSKAQREFVSEAEEILESMRDALADLSECVRTGTEPNPEWVASLFRSAHSFKALAGLLHFEPIEGLAHALEDVLDRLRLGRVASGEGLVALVEESVALLGALLGRVGDQAALDAAEAQIEDLATRLVQAAREPAASDRASDGPALDPELLQALTEYEEHRLQENLRRGRFLYTVEATFSLDDFEAGLSALTDALKERGELISTLPSAGDTPDASLCFRLLTATDSPAESWMAELELLESQVQLVAPRQSSDAASLAGESGEPEELAQESSLRSISETVRVDIRKLDELMNLVGEMVIQRGAIEDRIQRLITHDTSDRVGTELAKLHKKFDRKLRDLQSAVLEVRMVPLSRVFDKVSRVLRRIRADLGKEVELEIRGSETELDKLIVEGLIDPLMHVVRNAVDHGIEAPELRREAGKPRHGTLHIEALQRGNHVVIEVSDDGAGIDLARLRERAIERGLLTEDDTPSERETLELVFAPGMSTRDEVTGTSGRGVGMDVVRANLTELGGVVEIDSKPGRGTRIAMTVPITLAIVQSLVVRAADQRFAIPLGSVLETLWIEPGRVQNSEGRELIDLRGEPLLLCRLAREFQLGGADPTQPTVIVLGMGEQRLGLVVDDVEGQQDTVIKPILGPIAPIRGIAGGTDLGDRHPLLVLDVSTLIEDANRHREAA